MLRLAIAYALLIALAILPAPNSRASRGSLLPTAGLYRRLLMRWQQRCSRAR
jgi:hypothetical protein